jgi:hypothetical protein
MRGARFGGLPGLWGPVQEFLRATALLRTVRTGAHSWGGLGRGNLMHTPRTGAYRRFDVMFLNFILIQSFSWLITSDLGAACGANDSGT